MMLKIDEWIQKGHGEDGHQLTQDTCPHRVILTGMMSEIPFVSQEPKRGNAKFLLDAERSAAYFGKFRPEYFLYTGPGQRTLGSLKRYTDNPGGTWDELARQVTDVYLVQRHPILKGCKSFQRGELKRESKNMHFNAGAASQKMIMELRSSANEICMLYGMCAFLAQINKTGRSWKSPRFGFVCSYSKSLGTCQFVSSTGYRRPPRPCLVVNSKCMDSRGQPPANSKQSLNRSSCRKMQNVVRDKELVRLCNVADYKQLWQVLHSLRRCWQTNKFQRRMRTPKDKTQEQTWANQRNQCVRQKNALAMLWRFLARRTMKCWFGWARAPSKFKSCRQIASLNTVIVKENPANETSASSGQPAAREVTLKAKKDLQKKPQPLKKRICSTVPCSREVPHIMWTHVFPRRQHSWQGIQKNVMMMDHYRGKNTWNVSKLESPNLVKGLTPYQTFAMLTRQKKKERCEVCWQEGLEMTGQVFSRKLMKNDIMRNLFASEHCKVTQRQSGYFNVFSQKRLRKESHFFCTTLGSFNTWRFNQIRRTCARRFWSNPKRESVYFSLVSPLDQNPNPKYKPYFHLKNWLIWNRRKNHLSSTQQRSVVSYVTTQFQLSSSPRSSTSRIEQKGSWEHKQKKKTSPTKNSRFDRSQSRETSSNKSQKQEPHAQETVGIYLKHRKDFGRKQNSQSLRSMQSVRQKQQTGQDSAGAAQKLGGQTQLQERNARMTIDRRSQVIQLRIFEPNKRGNRRGSSAPQMQWATLRDHWRRCAWTSVTDPENPAGAENDYDGCGELGHRFNKKTTDVRTRAQQCRHGALVTAIFESLGDRNCAMKSTLKSWRSNKRMDKLSQWNNIQNILWPWKL